MRIELHNIERSDRVQFNGAQVEAIKSSTCYSVKVKDLAKAGYDVGVIDSMYSVIYFDFKEAREL